MIPESGLQCSSCFRVEELENRIEELEEKLALKDEKFKRLHKKLRKYRNLHTPSSKKRGSSKSKYSSFGRKKIGRKMVIKGLQGRSPHPNRRLSSRKKTVLSAGLSLKNLKKLD